jgi:asparagine synthase (glutamine-hydrolysing)
MCGICGIWGAPDARALEAMVQALRHRGPDDRGTFADGRGALGMARLAVLDVSGAGHQPMFSGGGDVVIVYNGEVYNFREQRRILEARGHAFRSSSDTEVVLRMYEEYGDDFLLRLRGMFALAVYDRRRPGRERLLLARDQLGVKPLLYAESAGRLLFASELKALLASGLVSRDPSPDALRTLLAYGSVAQPRTMLRDVRMLPPAHRLVADASGVRVERYWRLGLDREPGLRTRPYPEQVEAVGEALTESVRLQLVSDVPLGAFLSGGVDSSLLVALMAREMGAHVKTFSVGFGAEGAAIDETADAERMARHLGADHTRVVVDGTEVRDRIEHVAAALDQPTVDGVNAYFVSLAARRAVTVAISGTGGDELFAGYPWFIRMAQDAARRRRRPLRAAARALLARAAAVPAFDPWMVGGGGGRLDGLRAGTFLGRYAETYQIFGARRAAALLARAVRAPANAGRAPARDIRPFDELGHASAVERVSALAIRGYLTNQLLRDIDAVSMAHSLEVRVPFLDTRVADVALSLPTSAKLGDVTAGGVSSTSTYRDSGAKRVLIDVGRRWLPAGFDEQPKRGFAMPFGEWLRGPLREVLEDATGDAAVSARGWLEPAAVRQVRAEFGRGAAPWAEPWLLMMLELWARTVLDTPATRLAADSAAACAPAFAAAAGATNADPREAP